jgi:hypothetical protein
MAINAPHGLQREAVRVGRVGDTEASARQRVMKWYSFVAISSNLLLPWATWGVPVRANAPL